MKRMKVMAEAIKKIGWIPPKKPGLVETKFVERSTSGERALTVLKKLESPISAGLREGVKRITGRR